MVLLLLKRTTDKDFMMFLASIIILISIMGFSMGQIIRAPPEKDTAIYFNLISFVAGIFISPMRHPSNNDKIINENMLISLHWSLVCMNIHFLRRISYIVPPTGVSSFLFLSYDYHLILSFFLHLFGAQVLASLKLAQPSSKSSLTVDLVCLGILIIIWTEKS